MWRKWSVRGGSSRSIDAEEALEVRPRPVLVAVECPVHVVDVERSEETLA